MEADCEKLFENSDFVAEGDEFNSVGSNPDLLRRKLFQGRMPNIFESSGLHPTLLNLSTLRTFASFQTASEEFLH
jgi:hypothetical protein